MLLPVLVSCVWTTVLGRKVLAFDMVGFESISEALTGSTMALCLSFLSCRSLLFIELDRTVPCKPIRFLFAIRFNLVHSFEGVVKHVTIAGLAVINILKSKPCKAYHDTKTDRRSAENPIRKIKLRLWLIHGIHGRTRLRGGCGKNLSCKFMGSYNVSSWYTMRVYYESKRESTWLAFIFKALYCQVFPEPLPRDSWM